ncbi:PREDICTED: F-box protein At4g18380-like [Ipomoea nil]|uniref:F-box protein At4g18380-like n=1 Tax=Ipomoea nil TaxID=35883 RepID=UPI000900E8BB|nr:PREDICTED: F-box protein At4g18380-like [Ipomoea nil]
MSEFVPKMGYSRPDLSCRVSPEPVDHFDCLPDSLVVLVFNRIGDVKALGRCCVVSRRFHALVPQVENVVVKVDCVISDDGASSSASADDGAARRSRHSVSSLLRLAFSGLLKPLQSFSQFIATSARCDAVSSALGDDDFDQDDVTHHSPSQVLKNFSEIKFLQIELPSGELGIEDGVLLKWRADFGSTLENCAILGAAKVIPPLILEANDVSNSIHIATLPEQAPVNNNAAIDGNGENEFHTNGGLKMRVVWTISSLIAASARHYLLQPIIAEHKTLDRLVLTDASGQGILSMNREQLEELRVKPLLASAASKRTMVPALNMRLWYAPHLELPDGTVLKGASMVVIRPSEQPRRDVVGSDENSVASLFEQPYGTAVRMLMKRRTYCLEMNSF